MTKMPPKNISNIISTEAGNASGAKSIASHIEEAEESATFHFNAETSVAVKRGGYVVITDYAPSSFAIAKKEAEKVADTMWKAQTMNQPYFNITFQPVGQQEPTIISIPAAQFQAIISKCRAAEKCYMSWSADKGATRYGSVGDPREDIMAMFQKQTARSQQPAPFA